MQITYCDVCGTKLTADNRAGRQQTYTTVFTQEHPILPSKDVTVDVELTFASDVGMTRTAKNNGDFCQTCLEGVVITAMLARQAEQSDAEDEELEEEDAEETGDDLDAEGNVIEEEEEEEEEEPDDDTGIEEGSTQ